MAAETDIGKIAQLGALFSHTCFLYSPVRESTSNNPHICYLPESGNLQEGTFGAFKCGRQTQKRLLTTKKMRRIEFLTLLRSVLSDCRDGSATGMSRIQCATERLLKFEPPSGTDQYTSPREMTRIYIVTYENEFPDQLMVEQPEPGNRCVVL
jgi:hypothetical protein